MARGEQRGNREAKKPKQIKPKETPAASPFAPKGGAPDKSAGGKKK